MENFAADRRIFADLLSFKPNRHTLGGASYLIVATPDNGLRGNWLIDCPAFVEENCTLIEGVGGIGAIFLTHRGAMGQVEEFCRHFRAAVRIHEQEAYLVKAREVEVRAFDGDCELDAGLSALWTPGHSPGSSCLLWQAHGGVLFSGRHLLPTSDGGAMPVRVGRTFHWPRQLASVERLGAYSYRHICPGAATGLLRSRRTIVVEP
ncbi:hypothetical protein [Gloeobacter violaceus]|uniref:Gll1735 protein n=1 Tax=Gloeobacter violaceus (strain ATCC 29082 / PCC 7421) TaxID=251221 RepID=Q7NJU7_GLOVI|nr:hypothetical protein [Gloeobacter violaceus]BAC89676.1 gll1735 [Gloeobacter violaceus PCC 7421]